MIITGKESPDRSLPALSIPSFSPEGLHQVEVSELMQIHEGMKHCQIQLFPGRTGTRSRAGRGLGRWGWRGGEVLGRLWPLFCTAATSVAKVSAKPPSQAWHGGRDTWNAPGKTICLKNSGVAELCAVGRNTANVLCWSSLMNSRFHGCPEMASYPPETHGESRGSPDAHKTSPTMSDKRTVPMHSRCPQAIPRKLEMTPMLPEPPVPMPPSCPQMVSAPQISRKFHTTQMSTQTLGISHGPLHLRHFRRSPHALDVHQWSPGFPDFTEGPHAPWESRWSPHTPDIHRSSACVPEVHQLLGTLDIHRWSSYTPDVSCTLCL